MTASTMIENLDETTSGRAPTLDPWAWGWSGVAFLAAFFFYGLARCSGGSIGFNLLDMPFRLFWTAYLAFISSTVIVVPLAVMYTLQFMFPVALSVKIPGQPENPFAEDGVVYSNKKFAFVVIAAAIAGILLAEMALLSHDRRIAGEVAARTGLLPGHEMKWTRPFPFDIFTAVYTEGKGYSTEAWD